MRILVTGGTGYIGGTVARLLLSGGDRVTIYDNLCHSKREAVATGAEFVEGDLADRALLEKTLRAGRFDGVMHFAALIEAGESMQKPEIYFRNNTVGTLTLLEAMLATGQERLVFSSTAACYGEPETTPILEDAPLAPTNAYGESKLMVEQMLDWFNRIHGLRYASLRYFNVAGAIAGYGEAHEPESHLIPLVLDVALGRRKSIKILARTIRRGMGRASATTSMCATWRTRICWRWRRWRDERTGVIYNIGNGQGFTVREVIESVRRVTGQADCGGGCRAAGGRSGGAGGGLGEDQAGAGLEAAVCRSGHDYGQRVGVAPEAVCMRESRVVSKNPTHRAKTAR